MRKIFSILLALSLIIGLFVPAVVSAEEPENILTLFAGKDWPIGTVEVTNDDQYIYVNFEMDSGVIEAGWVFTEFHLSVEISEEAIPQNKNGNPEPGHFEFSSEYDWTAMKTSESFTVEIPEGVEFEDDVVIAAHATITDTPNKDLNGAMFGTRTTNGTGLYAIDVIEEEVVLLEALNGTILENGTGYTNGLAYDPTQNKLYFTAPASVNVTSSPLWSYDIGTGVLERLCELEGSVVSGSFYNGAYYYIAEGVNALMRVISPGVGSEAELVVSGFGVASDFTFGDIAINSDGMIYGSTRVAPQMFFSLELSGTYNKYIGADALDLQLAFGSNWTLYGVRHSTGNFYSIDTTTGIKTEIALDARGFSDLASGTMFEPQCESAWAATEVGVNTFVDKGNWATYFTYTLVEPCIEVELIPAQSMFPGTAYDTENTAPYIDSDGTVKLCELSMEITSSGLLPGATYVVYFDTNGVTQDDVLTVGPWNLVGSFITNSEGEGTWTYTLSLPPGDYTYSIFINQTSPNATVQISYNLEFTVE